jgi:hypothetical protein
VECLPVLAIVVRSVRVTEEITLQNFICVPTDNEKFVLYELYIKPFPLLLVMVVTASGSARHCLQILAVFERLDNQVTVRKRVNLPFVGIAAVFGELGPVLVVESFALVAEPATPDDHRFVKDRLNLPGVFLCQLITVISDLFLTKWQLFSRKCFHLIHKLEYFGR